MKVISRLVTIMAVLAGVVLAAVMVLITVNVIARYFFNYNLTGVLEITEFGLLLATMLAAPWVLMIDKHVRVDIITGLIEKKSPKARWVLALIAESMGALFCAIVVYESLMVTISAYKTHQRSMSFLPTQLWPFYMFIPLCFTFMTILFVYRVVRQAKTRRVLQGELDMESSV
jgi:TRAP-type transport system small permease protein